jgi:hypothetical protein
LITPAKPQIKNLEPVFKPDFEAHMKGTLGHGTHTGCHTLYKVAKKGRKFAEDNGQEKKVLAPDCEVVYSAKVQLPLKTDNYGKVTWGAEKLSCFWPDDMCLECVKQAITLAWKNYKGVTDNAQKHNSQVVQVEKVLGTAKWAGAVGIKKKDAYRIWVGRPEEGTTGSPIYSAYPKIGTKFY